MKELYRDTGLVEGSHGGGDAAAALSDTSGKVDFTLTSCVGRLLENTTQDTSGAVTAETATTLTATGVTWDTDDEYVLYVTDTKNSLISSTEVCVRSGFAYPYWKLGEGGIHPDHKDVDERKMTGEMRRRKTKLRR